MGIVKHGHAQAGRPTTTYNVWNSMKARCQNPHRLAFHLYGGRGITVCERWQNFPNFLADMGERPKGMMLDRIDNNGHYAPENCRWATPETQANNRSRNRVISLNGYSLTLTQWAKKLRMSPAIIQGRLNRGHPPKIALRPFKMQQAYRTKQLAFAGFNLSLSEWGRKLSLDPHAISRRIKRGDQAKNVLRPFTIRKRRQSHAV